MNECGIQNFLGAVFGFILLRDWISMPGKGATSSEIPKLYPKYVIEFALHKICQILRSENNGFVC